jgi:hypothetical protein
MADAIDRGIESDPVICAGGDGCGRYAYVIPADNDTGAGVVGINQ